MARASTASASSLLPAKPSKSAASGAKHAFVLFGSARSAPTSPTRLASSACKPKKISGGLRSQNLLLPRLPKSKPSPSSLRQRKISRASGSLHMESLLSLIFSQLDFRNADPEEFVNRSTLYVADSRKSSDYSRTKRHLRTELDRSPADLCLDLLGAAHRHLARRFCDTRSGREEGRHRAVGCHPRFRQCLPQRIAGDRVVVAEIVEDLQAHTPWIGRTCARLSNDILHVLHTKFGFPAAFIEGWGTACSCRL